MLKPGGFLQRIISLSNTICQRPTSTRPSQGLYRALAMASQPSYQRAVVKLLPSEPNLTITLTLAGKQRNLDRPRNEPLEKSLARIQKSAEPQGDKKRQRRNQIRPSSQQQQEQQSFETRVAAPEPPSQSAGPLFVGLHSGSTPLDPLFDPGRTTNEEAWKPGHLLRVGDASYVVELNPPIVQRIEAHGQLFVGIPVVPTPKLLFADVQRCTWQWQRRVSEQATATDDSRAAPTTSSEWSLIPGATSRAYTPREEDEGCMLRVLCTPARRHDGACEFDAANGENILFGDPLLSNEFGPVKRPPSSGGAGRGRHELTRDYLASPHVRVVTYNVLADQYAATESAKNVIFASCPPQFLDPLYRRPLVLGEVLGYHPDIVCLQEVDERMFTACLQPALECFDFSGTYTNKAGLVREGSATFWRNERFELVARKDITLRELFPQSSSHADVASAKYGPTFAPMLTSSPSLCTALQRVATIAQLTLLTPRELVHRNRNSSYDSSSGYASSSLTDTQVASTMEDAVQTLRPLCVINTHLFFHYAAPHIRTMHVWAILQEAREFIKNAMKDDSAVAALYGGGGDTNHRELRKPAVVFCGDLNSDLNDGIPGAIELLGAGRVSAGHWDWAFGVGFKWEKDNDEDSDDAEEKRKANKEGRGTAEAGELQKMIHTDVEGRRPESPTSASSAGGLEEQHQSQGLVQGRFEIVPGVELSSPFGPFKAADGLQTELTNYVRGYQGLLDYIWFDPHCLTVHRLIPPPTKDALGGYLPSERFPSDHVAVVADLTFVSETPSHRPVSGDTRRGNSLAANLHWAASPTCHGSDTRNATHDGGAGSGGQRLAGGDGDDAGDGDNYDNNNNNNNNNNNSDNNDDLDNGGAQQQYPVAVHTAGMHNVGAAVAALGHSGGIIAMPTDTIYGLAACAADGIAVRRIYAAKRRRDTKPLAICVADIDAVERYVHVAHLPRQLLQDLLPGAVTLLLPRREDAPLTAELNPGVSALGVRIPDAAFIRAVCRQHCGALALTSANLSGGTSPLTLKETVQVLPECKAAFDAGVLGVERSGSTVVDLTRSGTFVIHRQGTSFEHIIRVLVDKHGLIEAKR